MGMETMSSDSIFSTRRCKRKRTSPREKSSSNTKPTKLQMSSFRRSWSRNSHRPFGDGRSQSRVSRTSRSYLEMHNELLDQCFARLRVALEVESLPEEVITFAMQEFNTLSKANMYLRLNPSELRARFQKYQREVEEE